MNIRLGKNFSQILGVVVQALIWVTFLILIPLGWKTNWPAPFWIKQFVTLVLLMSLYYINSLIFVPRLLLRNKTFGFLTALALSLLFIMIAMQLVEISLNLRELLFKTFNPNKSYTPPDNIFRFDFITMILTLLVFGISTSVALINRRNLERESRQAFEKQKISTELAMLKSQINPHFYFNTLNSIYALTNTNSKLAQKAIHMLSKMMRYVLYESQKKEVLLSQELEFIVNYIDLMRLRLTEKVEVRFNKPNSVVDVLIVPMIFIPFIENAFKHGIHPGKYSLIDIEIYEENNQVILSVVNDIARATGMDIERQSGIGLANTKRRLELLYPDKHKLTIRKEDNKHFVELMLILDPANDSSK